MPERASQKLLDELLSLHPKLIDLSLKRMHRLMAALGNPEQNCPPIIHIAGTNGKGSTLAFLRAMLEADGKSVHSYTSPHLVQFHERIALNGVDIDEKELSICLEHCQKANAGAQITVFEIITAAAFLAFSRQKADYLLLEVGLGGRLDATNIITPHLSLITPVSLDHQDFLGTTLREIAAEKAGILKPDIPAIIAPQPAQAKQTIYHHAQHNNTPCLFGGEHWHTYAQAGRLIFQDDTTLLDLPLPRLTGAHQLINAGTAIAAARHMEINAAAIATGLERARWRARLEPLYSGAVIDPLKKRLPASEIWLDGGHNEAAAQALRHWAETATHMRPAPLHIICGLMRTKSADEFLTALPEAHMHCIPIPAQENSFTADELSHIAKMHGIDASAHKSIQDAMAAIEDENARILICGSLYLAGFVLAQNG